MYINRFKIKHKRYKILNPMIIKRSSNRKKLTIIAVAVLLFAAGVLAFSELTDRSYIFHDKVAVSGVIPSTTVPSETSSENKAEDASTPSESTSATSPKEGDSTTETAPSGAAPITPFGNFVSNHSPNLDGSPNPRTVQSVCNTSAGAKCSIEFIKDGVVKSLEAQTTDGTGATYWNWDVDQAGLTPGTWKIKAIATLNGQTATAEDIQNLEVGP